MNNDAHTAEGRSRAAHLHFLVYISLAVVDEFFERFRDHQIGEMLCNESNLDIPEVVPMRLSLALTRSVANVDSPLRMWKVLVMLARPMSALVANAIPHVSAVCTGTVEAARAAASIFSRDACEGSGVRVIILDELDELGKRLLTEAPREESAPASSAEVLPPAAKRRCFRPDVLELLAGKNPQFFLLGYPKPWPCIGWPTS
jgi:hypothetical protein